MWSLCWLNYLINSLFRAFSFLETNFFWKLGYSPTRKSCFHPVCRVGIQEWDLGLLQKIFLTNSSGCISERSKMRPSTVALILLLPILAVEVIESVQCVCLCVCQGLRDLRCTPPGTTCLCIKNLCRGTLNLSHTHIALFSWSLTHTKRLRDISFSHLKLPL